ncbi:MAG: RNA-binding S4 domain-containing protein [Erysipelotrichaceae bacterium]
MRLDKYLKVARILKKRTLSKELADADRVTINGKVAKPASLVQVGDVLEISFGNKIITIKVLGLAKQASKHDAAALYEIVNERFIEQETANS